ncbi:MAG: type II toxin-antitoxin system prevent-host-death family antitoxin [Chloroflexota bacterium]|nr:type II toxin-antitoxin system prevent-host-death family antitoxin [Chloroflexota bacterium]
MAVTYSTYEAKARFSEVIRHVRAGRTVTVTYRGEPVAEIKPLAKPVTFKERIDDLRARGILSGPSRPRTFFDRGTRVPGALQEFLEERD